MKKAKVVIGAGFGDEGKGLVTDWLASQAENPLVIRFNGGAQAGHTVVTPEGKRHVFSHFGAGTLAGAKTYLSRHFIVNPILFWQEYKRLSLLCARSIHPIIHPGCPITTPYDMLINQALEKSRGEDRHGSCGVGINETVVRHETMEFAVSFGDMSEDDRYAQKIKKIRDRYIPHRIAQLGIEKHVDMDILNSDILLQNFLEDSEKMDLQCFRRQWAGSWKDDFDLIFEGAQGLKLDKDHRNFPHVTPSNTGLTNVRNIIGHDAELDVYYVTRAYATRHGAGPLRNEGKGPQAEFLKDLTCPTNKPNEFQGSFRYAALDVPSMIEDINQDRGTGLAVSPHLVVTCMDHTPSTWGQSPYRYIASAIGAKSLHFSLGPTRKDIRKSRSLNDDS
jgi:adenylosuccinate synthase